jgi:hypothetical protein
MEQLQTVKVPFKGKFNFQVRRGAMCRDGQIVFSSESKGNTVVTFGKESFQIHNTGDELAVIPISAGTLKVQTYL